MRTRVVVTVFLAVMVMTIAEADTPKRQPAPPQKSQLEQIQTSLVRLEEAMSRLEQRMEAMERRGFDACRRLLRMEEKSGLYGAQPCEEPPRRHNTLRLN